MRTSSDPVIEPPTIASATDGLPEVRRDHLEVLSRAGPIAQHARGTVPDPAHGSCTDDVARALQVDLLHGAVLGWARVAPSAWRSLRYLDEALVDATGRFRNFRAADGTWLEEMGSEDAHGRAVLALGEALGSGPDRSFREHAASIFRRSLPGTVGLAALRSQAAALIGCDAALTAGVTGQVGAVGRHLIDTLARRFEPIAWSSEWPWPESIVTYEAALLPRALLVAGRRSRDRRVTEMGLMVLDWLSRAACAPDGRFSPVGNAGWWPRVGTRARFDQQPIEAASFALAAETALEATGDPVHLREMERAYRWFLGWNDLRVVVADPDRGGCRDGLRPDGLNDNQGAESTLAWLTTLERMRIVDRRWPPST